ncbi:MAG: ABC transporter substrate-binding protein [Rhodoferax sp.]
MKRDFLRRVLVTCVAVATLGAGVAAHAEDEAADALIKRLSVDVLETIKNDKAIRAGDTARLIALVDERIMPNVNFQRMTASAVGPAWRQASPEQQKRLQEEFKTLLVRTYAGALAQVTDQTISMKPMRASPEDKEVVVRSEVRGGGSDPIQLDYRLEKTPGQGAGWRIYNLNVLGVWLVETYRSQFAQEINAKGLDGLIALLTERNKANKASNKKA